MDDRNGTRRTVVPLGEARRQQEDWPCVGDPDTWESAGNWFNCGRLGTVSLMALVPMGQVMDPQPGDEWEPSMVHLTVCPGHTRKVRQWLRARMLPEDDVITAGTEFVLREWQQLMEPMEVPVWSPSRSATG